MRVYMIFYILASLFFVNASDITKFDYEKFLNSTSLQYENIFAESFEDYLNILTENMKIDLILEDNKDQIWKNYVEKLKSIQPNYQQILNIIKEKKYIETDVTTGIVSKYFEEEKLKELSLGKDIMIKNIVDNASNFDYEKFLNSISLQYEKILAKSFEDYLNVLTENIKIDLISEENMDQNTIWNNYVQKIRDAKPDYQQILDIIKEKKYIETDVTTRIVRNHVEEKNLEVFLDNKIIIKKIVKNIVDYVGVLIPKEVDIWLRQGIPLGAEGRFQLILKFNTNIKNLFGDAVAFYFLYGPQQFMKIIEMNMKKPPIQIDEEYEKKFLSSIIKEVIQNPSTISATIGDNFKKVFLENLKINVLKKQTSLKDFQITTYGGVFDNTIEFLNIQSVIGCQRQKYSFILKKLYPPKKENKKVPYSVCDCIFILFVGIILEFILQCLFFYFFSVPTGFL